MYKYLVTIKGNDVFVYDCELTANDVKELAEKLVALDNNIGRQTIEQTHVESVILL